MFSFLDYPFAVFVYFFLVFLRIFGFFSAAPFFGDRSIPFQIRIMLALMLTFIIFPFLKVPAFAVTSPFILAFYSSMEFVLGLTIGFMITLVFSGFSLAGQVAGYQMGLAIANVFDPSTMNRQSIVSSLLFWAAMMVFFVSNMHLVLIRAIVESFHRIPLFLQFSVDALKVMDINRIFSTLFVVSVQIGSPIIFTLLFVMVSLGLITRLIPQMNIFIVGIPLQILVGFLVLIAMMPLVARLSYSLLLHHMDLVMGFIQG